MVTRRSLIRRASALAAASVLPGAAVAQTARAAGFRYAEETAPHERTFMQWPVSRAVYGGGSYLDRVQETIADIANTVAEFEPVVMLMASEHEATARKLLGKGIEIWDVPTEDLWARDSGPSFVVDGKGGLAMTQFNFNGWGGKQPHRNDSQVARRVAEIMGLTLYDAGLVGEAGGAEFDGHATLIAHESSWVNKNRNKGGKDEITRMLLDTYGAKKLIWAPGIKGADITDFHIDALARFTEPGVALIQMGDEIDPADPWSRAAFETYDILAAATDASGRKLELVRLPEPIDIRGSGNDFVASYVNYYVCNGAVIASHFGDDAADEEAQAILSDRYPGREIVMLDTDPVGEAGGGIHCATHEQPKV
ncbi:agmatine deiminase family protein [Ruegeria aquimaris]|uniref:Agmatine deiminase family protein n=1 Tax=Ruegeria aquimaris TaxID=2984333 RepID=A0ABT3AM89_9RHOB|nr:agmatine deiminase family protein [Ruegeria sp. XHP0148]MCV2889697.1 agmatine deiminase family protein [Ruegeria sp. XHP0148]